MSSRLHLFGKFRWQGANGEDLPELREKTQALVAYIALSANGIVQRRLVAQLLWGDGKAPNASLRQSVRELKTALGHEGINLFQVDASYLSFNLNQLWVDVRVASQCASRFDSGLAEQILETGPDTLLKDISVVGEEFDEWLLTERSRRESDLVVSLETLLRQSLDINAGPDRVRKIANSLLRLDASNEKAHRALMRALFESGDRGAALRQYENCVEILEKEVGVIPSQETEELAAAIRDGNERTILESHISAREIGLLNRHGSIQAARPVILVEPFTCAPKEDVTEYVKEVFRGDICEQLSRNRRFSIQDSTVKLSGTNRLLAESGRVTTDYILQGNILENAGNLSLLVRLLDGKTGEILWMSRDAFLTSEFLSGKVEAAALAAVEMLRFVELQETEKAHKTEDSLLDSRQCVRRAVSCMFRFSREAVAEANQYLQRALLLQPNDSEALSWLAFLRSIEVGQGYSRNAEATRDETRVLTQHSIELSPNDDIALAIAGHLEAFIHHDFESAIEYFDRALQANSNCAYAWGFRAITSCYLGEPEKALSQLQRCRKIMPFDPHPYYFDTARCIASMLAGKYEDAVRIGKQVLRNNPNFHANYRPLISSLGHLGRREEAEPVLEEFSRYQPDFSVSWHLENYPPLDADRTARYIEGLRKAGVME